MPTLYMDWNSDLIVSPNGSLQMAFGWDQIRQRILRRILTTAQELLPDGTQTLPDYIFDVNYGIGARKLVGQPVTTNLVNQLKQAITNGVMQDAAVVPNVMPNIKVIRSGINTVFVTVEVFLTNQTPGTISFKIV